MTIAELFYAKQAHRARSFIPLRRPSQRRKHPPRHRKFLLEPLEPRVLLSAEPTLLHVEMLALGPNLTIRLDGTTQLLQVVETPTGAVVAERPREATDEVVVTGTDGDDTLAVDPSVPGALPVHFDGGAGTDRLDVSGRPSPLALLRYADGTALLVGPEEVIGASGVEQFIGADEALSLSGV